MRIKTIEKIITAISLAIEIKASLLDDYNGTRILNNRFQSIIDPSELSKDYTPKKFKISKKDNDVEIYLQVKQTEFIHVFNESMHFLEMTDNLVDISLVEIGNIIKKKYITVLSSRKIYVYKVNETSNADREEAFNKIYYKSINGFSDPECSQPKKFNCQFVGILQSNGQGEFYACLEYEKINLEKNSKRVYLVGLDLNWLLTQYNDSVPPITPSAPLEIDPLVFKIRPKYIFESLVEEIPCKAEYQYLYSIPERNSHVFVRFCPMNYVNIDEKISEKYRNQVEVYIYGGKDKPPYKMGQLSRYDISGKKRFDDEFLMIKSIERLENMLLIFDKRGYGYSQLNLEKNLEFRIIDYDQIHSSFCDSISGKTLSCALIRYTGDSQQAQSSSKENLSNESPIDMNNKAVNLVEFISYENSLLKIDLKLVSLNGDSLLNVIHFDYEVAFLTTLKSGEKKLEIVLRKRDNALKVIPIDSRTFDIMFLSYGSSLESFHGGDGLMMLKNGNNNSYEFLIFESNDPLILLKPIAHLNNSNCESFLERCAEANLTFQEQGLDAEGGTGESYSVKAYVIDQNFSSILSKSKSNMIIPQFKYNKFIVEIDDYFLGTIVDPHIVNYGEVHTDYIMRSDKLFTKGTRFLKDFATIYTPETDPDLSRLGLCGLKSEKASFYHRINLDSTVSWMIIAPALPGGSCFIYPRKAYSFENKATEDLKLQFNVYFLLGSSDYFLIKFTDDKDFIHYLEYKRNENTFPPTSSWRNDKIELGKEPETRQKGPLETSTMSHTVLGFIEKVSYSNSKGNDLLVMITTDGAYFYRPNQNFEMGILEFLLVKKILNKELKVYLEIADEFTRVKIADVAIWKLRYILLTVKYYTKVSSKRVIVRANLICFKCDISTLKCDFNGMIQLSVHSKKMRDIVYLTQKSENLVVLSPSLKTFTVYRFDIKGDLLVNGNGEFHIPPLQKMSLNLGEKFEISKIYHFVNKKDIFVFTRSNVILLYAQVVNSSGDFSFMSLKINIDKDSLISLRKYQEVEFSSEGSYSLAISHDKFGYEVSQILRADKNQVKILYFWNSNALGLDINFEMGDSMEISERMKDIPVRFTDVTGNVYEEYFTVKLRKGFKIKREVINTDLKQPSNGKYVIRQYNWGVIGDVGFHCARSSGASSLKPRYVLGRNRLKSINCGDLKYTLKKQVNFLSSLSNIMEIEGRIHNISGKNGNYGDIRSFETRSIKQPGQGRVAIFVILTKNTLIYGVFEEKIKIRGEFDIPLIRQSNCFKLLPITSGQEMLLSIRIVCQKNSTLLKVDVKKDEFIENWIKKAKVGTANKIKFSLERLLIPNFVVTSLMGGLRYAFVTDFFIVIKEIFFSESQPKYFLNIYKMQNEGKKINFHFLYTGLSEKYANYNTISFYIDRVNATSEEKVFNLILVKKHVNGSLIMVEGKELILAQSSDVLTIKSFTTYQKRTFPFAQVSNVRIASGWKTGTKAQYMLFFTNQEYIYEVSMFRNQNASKGEGPRFSFSKNQMKYFHIGLCPPGSRYKVGYSRLILILNCLSFGSDRSQNIIAIFNRSESVKRENSSSRREKTDIYPSDKIEYTLGVDPYSYGAKFHPSFSFSSPYNRIYITTAHTLIDEYYLESSKEVIVSKLETDSGSRGQFYVTARNLFYKHELRLRGASDSAGFEFKDVKNILNRWYCSYCDLLFIVLIYCACILILSNIQNLKLCIFSDKIVEMKKEEKLTRVSEMTRRTLTDRRSTQFQFEHETQERRISQLF